MRRTPRIREDDIPVRNPTVEAYGVGDDAVLYDSERDQVYAVSAVARELWSRCDGNIALAQIGRTMSSHIDRPLEHTVDQLQHVASDLIRQDLLLVPNGSLSAEEHVRVRNIVFGDHQVKVRTDATRFDRAVRRHFRDMLGEDEGLGTLDVLTAQVLDGTYQVKGTRGSPVQERSLETAARRLKHKVVRRFMEARRDLIWLHAGAAVRDDTSVLVAGEWGSGKSTIIANLCRSGWTYLSDDVVPYDPDSKAIIPFPTTIAYRQTAKNQLSEQELAGSPKQYVDLDSERLQKTPVQVQSICFPTFEPDCDAELEKQTAAEAAVSLVENCQNAGRYRGEAVRQLCQMADRASAFRLLYSNKTDISSVLASVIPETSAVTVV